MSNAGKYAKRGAIIAGAIGCAFGLLGLPLVIAGTGVAAAVTGLIIGTATWALVGAGIGGLIGVFTGRNKDSSNNDAKTTSVSTSRGNEPALEHEQSQQAGHSTNFRDHVTTSRSPGYNTRT